MAGPSLDAAFAVFGVFWGSWGALLPDVKAAVSTTDGRLGRALLFIALGSIPAMFAAGRLADRLGPRLVPAALVPFGITVILPFLTSDVAELTLALFLLGLSTGFLDVVINAAVITKEALTGRTYTGRAHAAFSAGVLLGGVGAGLAVDLGATPLEVAVAAAVASWTVAVVCRSLPGPQREARSVSSSGPLPRVIILLGAVCGLTFLIEDGVLSWSALHLRDTLGAGPAVGGLGPGLLAGAMVAGRATTARVRSKLKDPWALGLGGLTAAVGATVIALAPNAPVALAGIAVTGLGISVCAPIVFSVAGGLGGPGRQGAAVARTTSIAYIGFVIGPPLIGAVAGAAGLRWGFGVVAAIALIMGAGGLLTPRASRRVSA